MSACSSGRSPTSSKIDAFGLFTGQVGYAANNVLFYVKGGAAVTGDRYRRLASPAPASVASTADDTRWGAVVGAGLEFGFAPNWSAGDRIQPSVHGTATPRLHRAGRRALGNDRIQQDVDLVTVRVNYRWGGPVIAKY